MRLVNNDLYTTLKSIEWGKLASYNKITDKNRDVFDLFSTSNKDKSLPRGVVFVITLNNQDDNCPNLEIDKLNVTFCAPEKVKIFWPLDYILSSKTDCYYYASEVIQATGNDSHIAKDMIHL